MTTTRVAFKMKLKEGHAEEYKKRHDEIWPELKSLLTQCGIQDYSIFLDEETNTLFAVHNLKEGSTGANDLGSNPVVQRWWTMMADIMETNDDKSPVTVPLREMFHLP
ncbi:L-rhamnose 1-epimerase [Nitzschia inconspicua]|uniref:L-rhamnose 1-epimerase n=1 Tax=Nitzschia inconspicua TaxID=303405 RepID=A0A9K3LHG4_9STRA|nr:L-rhamnose 1-epimerase [Nitzschia inconspicua]